MIKLFLVRHGQTSYNADGNRYCGKTDVELTSKGKAQARILAEMLKETEFEAIYSSPLKRAVNTAKTIAPEANVIIDKRLTELDFGSWEGKTRAEFIKENPVAWEKWNEDPGINRAGGDGESAGELLVRLDDFLEEILKKYHSGNILIVAHNGVNRFLIARQLEMPLRNYRKVVQENSTLTIIKHDEVEGFALEKLNCTSRSL